MSDRPGKGLGMGLSALLGDAPRKIRRTLRARAAVAFARSRLRGSDRIPNQPRIQFSEEAIDELADSIAERGVLQPILLRPKGEEFEIIAGERRWRAAQRAQLAHDPGHRPRHRRGDDRRARADRKYPARGSQRHRGGRRLSPAHQSAMATRRMAWRRSSTSHAAMSPTC